MHLESSDRDKDSEEGRGEEKLNVSASLASYRMIASMQHRPFGHHACNMLLQLSGS